MGQIDEAKEWRRLAELYASLEEGELVAPPKHAMRAGYEWDFESEQSPD